MRSKRPLIDISQFDVDGVPVQDRRGDRRAEARTTPDACAQIYRNHIDHRAGNRNTSKSVLIHIRHGSFILTLFMV